VGNVGDPSSVRAGGAKKSPPCAGSPSPHAAAPAHGAAAWAPSRSSLRQALPTALIDLRLLHPAPERLRCDPELLHNGAIRSLTNPAKPDRLLPELRGKTLSLRHVDSILDASGGHAQANEAGQLQPSRQSMLSCDGVAPCRCSSQEAPLPSGIGQGCLSLGPRGRDRRLAVRARQASSPVQPKKLISICTRV
jgi:hypothetical protein